jgi:hypothetical protein
MDDQNEKSLSQSSQKTETPKQNQKSEGPEQSRRIVEKYYIEVNPSPFKKFLTGLLGGIGWGVGLTIGTGAIIYVLAFIVAKIDFVPVFGQFLADVIKSAQGNLNTR